MGRFTAYDQNGRMVADFDKSEYDFLCRYGRKPEEVLDENAKLRELVRFALHRCNADNPMCDSCCDGYDGECELEQRMRELGVEVER